MPQAPSVPMFCGAQTCGEGDACCRATGECYPATCIGCCPTDLPPIVTHPRLGPDSGIEPQVRWPGHLPVPIPLPPAPPPAPR